ncbi:F-box/WD repeat-containing protein 11-like [Daphnia carinata]|uniref:F-box/WD repeat-containing protein 11-like n=1 Tax=Daphnia carinata TaxID=120202 RepID=UPI0025809A20|nr:F-box/WD repeat-containing protein 11-like [Daphnia carinata]XP_057366317.1 F-box/WD repeat-containing protein 11-like [Daphnia carinata]XP_059351169.1 F-box/WD repeat-containing protein 11-like [Daphnia carinata]
MNLNGNKKRKRSISNERKKFRTLKKWKVTNIRPTFVEDRDIIRRLNGNGVTHIVEHIFSYLDYKSLSNAESVSSEWCEILKNERIWKALIKRNIVVDPVWRTLFMKFKQPVEGGQHAVGDDVFMTRKICQDIGKLHQQFVDLMSSSVNLLSSSVKLISKMLELLRFVGFSLADHYESDHSEED